MAEEKPKEWEQAWPPTKIRQQATDWNLAGDAGLLLQLRQASSDLMSRFENTKKNTGDLTDEVQKTVVRLDTTINDFSFLANNQFIESRVYDDDAKPSRDPKANHEVAKTKEEREAEVVSVMKSALGAGCALLDIHFTKVDVRPLDFDEDDDPGFNPQPVFEPKDPYSNRPLPYVIATADFMKSESVGLREDEEEAEENKKQETPSESDDETAPPIPAGLAPTKNQQQAIQPLPPASAAKAILGAVSPSVEGKAASDSSSGLFGTSADSAEQAFPSATVASQKGDDHDASTRATRSLESDFRSELTKKLAGAATYAPAAPKEKPKQAAAPSAGAVSNARAVDDTDEDILFSPPPLLPRQKQYDDSDEEGGLFKPRSRGLFDDDDDEESKPPPLPRGRLQQLADSGRSSTASRGEVQPVPVATRESSTSSASVAPAAQVQPPTLGSRLLDTSTTSKSKSVSMFADDDESDDDDLFGRVYKKEAAAPRPFPSTSVKSSVDETAKKPVPVVARQAQPSSIIGAGASLFGGDDDDEDDLFTVLKRPTLQAASKSQGLFGEETASKVSVKTEPKPGAYVIPPPTSAQEEKTDVSESSKRVPGQGESGKPEAKPVSDSLFSRSPSPPPLATSAVYSAKKESSGTRGSASKGGGGLFGDDGDDDSFFPTTIIAKSEAKEAKEEKPAKKSDFRAELAKKLLAGPQPGGLLRAKTNHTDDEESQQDAGQVNPPSDPTFCGKRNEPEGADSDHLFKPPAHAVLGDGSSADRVDNAEKKLNFDSATSVETLPTLQKNRAKLPNRRPPSKHVPLASDGQNGFDAPPVRKEPSSAKEQSAAESIDTSSSINADPLGVRTNSASTSSLGAPPAKKPEEVPKKEKEKVDEKPAQKTKASILFDDDDDDDLFGIIDKKFSKSRTANQAKVQEQRKSVAAATTTSSTTISKGTTQCGDGGLFSDDDLFSDTKRPAVKKPVQPAADDDADIFATKKKTDTAQQKSVAPTPPQDAKKGKSLFDDDDDDIDIFR